MHAGPGSILLVVVVAGCLSTSPPVAVDPDESKSSLRHVLEGVVEPGTFEPPVFQPLGRAAKGGGSYTGEPSIWVHTDGTIYVSYPGCIDGKSCENGPVLKSTDEGKTWTYLNNPATGRLGNESHAANGDADVAVDAAGTVYATDLGGGIQVFRSEDGGATWEHASNVGGSDRQWMTAGDAGHLIVTIRGGEGASQAEIVMSRDGGRTWTEKVYVGDDVAVMSPVALDVTGQHAYFAFTQPDHHALGLGGVGWIVDPMFHLYFARSHDGGATWEVVPTGIPIQKSLTGLHWPGGLIFPAVDVTSHGHVALAWAAERNDPTGLVKAMGVDVFLSGSSDGGKTWSKPVRLNARSACVLPWVTAGGGDRVVVTYLCSDAQSDSDAADEWWDVTAAVVDGVGQEKPIIKEVPIEPKIHQGSVGTRGGLSQLTGSDRSLLDFFESDLLPDGRIMVTYPANPDGGVPEIRTAIQTGGTPLFERPPPVFLTPMG